MTSEDVKRMLVPGASLHLPEAILRAPRHARFVGDPPAANARARPLAPSCIY